MLNPNNSRPLWNQIVAEYRQACWLRREGRESDAARVINEKLPVIIAAWSQADTRSAADKKIALEAMFETEQTSVDSWLFAHQTLATRLTDALIPVLRQQVGQEVRQVLADQPQPRPNRSAQPAGERGTRRIRFDDIPAVIDALLAQQQADYGPKPAFAF